MAVKLVR